MSSLILRLLLASVTLFSLACEKKPAQPTLKLAIWGNYLSPELQKKFTEETGIKIEMTHYSSNEELLAKVQAGGTDLDVAVPSDYMVKVMAQLNLLEKLDRAQLSNFKNLDPQVLNQEYDPQNNFSIPYGWTTTGIAIHRGIYKGEIKSLKDLFEKPELKGQISVLDDMRELAGAALKMQDKSVNTTDPEEIKAAFDYLKKVKPQVKVFTSNAVDLLKNKEIKAGLIYSTDALLAQKEDPNIEFILASEGGTRAIDNLVILKSSPRKESAHKFLNYLMTKASNLDTVQNIRTGPVVLNVKNSLPEDLQKNKALFPEPPVYKKLEGLQDLGDKNVLYENQWTDLKLNL